MKEINILLYTDIINYKYSNSKCSFLILSKIRAAFKNEWIDHIGLLDNFFCAVSSDLSMFAPKICTLSVVPLHNHSGRRAYETN